MQADHCIKTYFDPAADPPWIATAPNVSNLLEISTLDPPPPFAATGRTETEAITLLSQQCGWLPVVRCQAPSLVNLHQVQNLLRKAYCAHLTLHDLAVLFCLLRHHPRGVPRSLIKDETSIARQTLKRALDRPDLIQVDHRPDSPLLPAQAHQTGGTAPCFHTLTAKGLQLASDFLRLLVTKSPTTPRNDD